MNKIIFIVIALFSVYQIYSETTQENILNEKNFYVKFRRKLNFYFILEFGYQDGVSENHRSFTTNQILDIFINKFAE